MDQCFPSSHRKSSPTILAKLSVKFEGRYRYFMHEKTQKCTILQYNSNQNAYLDFYEELDRYILTFIRKNKHPCITKPALTKGDVRRGKLL